MSDISERVLDRLENLENIEPLLGSLRILSLSTMQMALNRKTQLQTYKEEFMRILRLLLQTLQKDTLPAPGGLNQGAGRALLVVLGSERGICGMYNKNLAASAGAWQAAEIAPNQVQCFGGKLCQAMRQQGAVFDCHDVISQGSVPRYQRAQELVAAWLTEFKAGQLSAVDILSFRKPPSGFYKPVITRLIPLIAQLVLSGEDIETWPPPIIEGDPLEMSIRTVEHLTTIHFYELILESISAENAVRYNLLEEAKANTRELIESLVVEVQMAKKQAITQEMLELASGAGLTN